MAPGYNPPSRGWRSVGSFYKPTPVFWTVPRSFFSSFLPQFPM